MFEIWLDSVSFFRFSASVVPYIILYAFRLVDDDEVQKTTTITIV